MKKIFYLASIAALAFSSCAKDETTEAALGTVGGSKIIAAMETNDTRTELVENNGAYSFVWKGGDILSVYEDVNSGTDAAYRMTAVPFELEPSASGQASGAFNSKVGELQEDVKYVALYPKAGSSITGGPVWDKSIKIGSTTYKKQFDFSKVKMTVPAEQTYVPGSFDNNTVPAISTAFTVNGEGEATVDMQPVVDYLMVDIQSTEPINQITLSLVDAASFDSNGNLTSGTSIAITGEGTLEAYTVNGNVRYVLTNAGMTDKFITLKTKNLGDNVSLAEANTYVFAIPGGILGAGNTDLVAELTIDGKKYYSTNSYLNGYPNATYTELLYRKAGNQGTNTLPVYNRNRENGIFWFNDSRYPVVHNPNNDFLIYDELDLFAYIDSYNHGNVVDAYVAEDAQLNVSVANMSQLIKKVTDDYIAYYGPAYANLHTVINNYVKSNGVFPTITAAAYNKEFKGNGATIANIDRPLASANGLFGASLEGKVSNLTLSNITAYSWEDETDADNDDKLIEKGYILAKDIWDTATLKNVTVEGLDALAVAHIGNVDHFNAIKIGEAGIGEVEHIFEGDFWMNKNLTISAEKWEALNDVEISVFHNVMPKAAHVVATLPAGADYATFTCGVDNVDATKVASVLIDGVSYWTGGVMEPAKTAAAYYNANVGAGGKYNAYKAIQYAEELAWGAGNAAYLVRDINLNGANELNWGMTYLADLVGAGHTISDLAMEVEGAGASGNVAPFSVSSVAAINFDGISIKVVTSAGKAVSKYISGVSDGITSATSVVVNNLAINAVPAKGNYTNVYDDTTNINIGWLTANTVDAKLTDVTVSNVQSNVMGIAGMVSKMKLTKTNAIFDGCAVTGNNTFAEGQQAMSEFAYYKETNYNVVGSLAGYVFNTSDVDTAVRFDDYVGAKPAFLYLTNAGSVINVNYNGVTDVTLENPAM